MLSVTGINHFYYLRDFTDMRYYSEGMTAEEQKRYINYLAERVREADLGLRARNLVLQDFLDKQKEYESRLSKLDDVLSHIDSLESSLKDEIRKRKNAERKVADLTAKLKFANKNRFGSKSQSAKKSEPVNDEKSDRNQDKDNFDGTPSSLPENSVANDTAKETSEAAPAEKERDLSKRPETYNIMGVQGVAKEYKSDLNKVRKYEHQVCLAHARAKFMKALEQAGDRNAEVFIKYIGYLYDLERQYNKDGLTDAERGDERQGLKTKEILISLRQHLDIEKDKEPATTTPYLMVALNYLDKFWNNIFVYVKDGSYIS